MENLNAGNTNARSEEELDALNKRCEELFREMVDLESRARFIQMQLLMHTAGILQMTHNGPTKRAQNSQLPNGVDRRPDSPASIYTYEFNRNNRTKNDDTFDERSLYRSPENLDGLMDALRNGTHHHSEAIIQQSQDLTGVEKRLEELNDRLRQLIIEANPERNRDYSLPPKTANETDPSKIEQQLDFLDQGLRDIGAEHTSLRDNSRHSMNAVEGRLQGLNNQMYSILNNSNEGYQNYLPPPPVSGGGSQEQLKYMEEGFSNIEQLQYSLTDEIAELKSKPTVNNQDSQYETTLLGLWSIIQAGEEQARQRKAERRRALAADPNADEELSPDEDDGMQEFSLGAFSTKVQMLYSRATSLKEKESILRRQIKQQRELNNKSDAQKEAEFARLNNLLEQARMEKAVADQELERAFNQLQNFDEESKRWDEQRNQFEVQRKQYEEQLRQMDEQGKYHEEQQRQMAEQRNNSESEALRDARDRYQALESQLREAQSARERSEALESQLREAQDDARIEAAEIKAELAESMAKMEEVTASLRAATAAKETAEARALDATNALNAKEQELRELEGEVVRLTTELTFAKAELDGAYGTRAERAAEVAANPTIKKELDELTAKNTALALEVESLRKFQEAASQSEAQARESERTLKQELAGMATDYEALTRESIQNEKERDNYEAMIDALRDEKEKLEMELSDERVKWLGVRSPGSTNGQPPQVEATSIRMLREDFRKMMRERTAEGLRAVRVCESVPMKLPWNLGC